MRQVRAPTALLLVLVLASVCSLLFMLARISPMDEADVPGTYRQDWSWGVETLVLNPDGTYSEEYRHSTGESFRTNGKWEMWKQPDGSVMVRVHDASIWPTPFDLGRGAPISQTYTFAAIQSWRGKMLDRTPRGELTIRLMRMP